MSVQAAAYTGKERFSVALSCILGYWLDFYNLVIVAFLMGAIQKSLSISLTQAGTITSVTLAGSVVGGILFGWLGDRIGRKNSLLLTLALFSGGAIVSAFSWNYASLLVFRFIAGIGLGGEWGAGMVLFNEIWNRERRGFGSSVVQAMAGAGVAAASVVAVWSLRHFGPEWGWRIALLTGGAPIVLMVYVRWWMPESKLWREYERLRQAGQLPPEKAAEASPLIEIFRGASGRYVALGIIAWGFYVISYQSITVFMPVLMLRHLAATPEVVRSATLLYAFFLSLCMLGVGWYSDRLGRKLGVLIPTVISIIGYIGIYFVGDTKYPGLIWYWPLLWWYLIWGAGQTSAAMFGPWLSELFPVEIRSTAVATVYTLGRAVGAISPFVVPAAAGAFGGNLLGGMMFGLVGSIVCLLTILRLPETAGRSFAVVEGKERESAKAVVSTLVPGSATE
jgi:MFS family permease